MNKRLYYLVEYYVTFFINWAGEQMTFAVCNRALHNTCTSCSLRNNSEGMSAVLVCSDCEGTTFFPYMQEKSDFSIEKIVFLENSAAKEIRFAPVILISKSEFGETLLHLGTGHKEVPE